MRTGAWRPPNILAKLCWSFNASNRRAAGNPLIQFTFVAMIGSRPNAVAVARGELTLRLIWCLARLALGLMIVVAASSAYALDAVSVRSDAPAIDLTSVLEHQHSDTDRIDR